MSLKKCKKEENEPISDILSSFDEVGEPEIPEKQMNEKKRHL